jgi:hypothetical protein
LARLETRVFGTAYPIRPAHPSLVVARRRATRKQAHPVRQQGTQPKQAQAEGHREGARRPDHTSRLESTAGLLSALRFFHHTSRVESTAQEHLMAQSLMAQSLMAQSYPWGAQAQPRISPAAILAQSQARSRQAAAARAAALVRYIPRSSPKAAPPDKSTGKRNAALIAFIHPRVLKVTESRMLLSSQFVLVSRLFHNK